MMRSKTTVATAVRHTDGHIELRSRPEVTGKVLEKLSKIPVVRGAVNLFVMMVSGMRIMLESAQMYGAAAEEYAPNRFERWLAKTLRVKPEDVLIGVSLLLALVMFVGVFVLLPSFLTSLLPAALNSYLRALFEGAVRIGLFLVYLYAMGFIKDINRTFMYHGAEHKVLAAYEHRQPLTPDGARGMSRFHPRCGTAFLLIVMVVAILVYGLFPFNIWWQRVLVRVFMLPLIAGLSYEILKLLSRSEHLLVRALRAPGMALQRFTTREPDDAMLAVSLAAFKRVLVADGLLPPEEDPEYQPPEPPVPLLAGSMPLSAPTGSTQ